MHVENNIQSPNVNTYSKVKPHDNEANLEDNKNQTSLETSNINNKNEKIETSALDSAFVYSDEKNLSFAEKLKKLVIENIFSKFKGEGESVSLFPNSNDTQFNVSQVTSNPYESSMSHSPFGFVYESTQEYYSKTTIDFSTSLSINTPKGQYDIELNLSFTHEYYERNSTRIAVSNAPMNLELPEDDESLKDLKRLDLVFDINKEEDENKTLFEQIREILRQIDQRKKENENNDFGHQRALSNKLFDSFKLWEKDEQGNFNPLAVGQGGIGIFLANSYSHINSVSASVTNGSASFESSSSTSSSSFAAIIGDIKA